MVDTLVPQKIVMFDVFQVKSRVLRILNMRGESVKAIRGIMREYAGNIGETADEKQREKEQEKIITLLDQFQA